jgi:hypothetical protein
VRRLNPRAGTMAGRLSRRSVLRYHFHLGPLAQLVEQLTLNQ